MAINTINYNETVYCSCKVVVVVVYPPVNGIKPLWTTLYCPCKLVQLLFVKTWKCLYQTQTVLPCPQISQHLLEFSEYTTPFCILYQYSNLPVNSYLDFNYFFKNSTVIIKTSTMKGFPDTFSHMAMKTWTGAHKTILFHTFTGKTAKYFNGLIYSVDNDINLFKWQA